MNSSFCYQLLCEVLGIERPLSGTIEIRQSWQKKLHEKIEEVTELFQDDAKKLQEFYKDKSISNRQNIANCIENKELILKNIQQQKFN